MSVELQERIEARKDKIREVSSQILTESDVHEPATARKQNWNKGWSNYGKP